MSDAPIFSEKKVTQKPKRIPRIEKNTRNQHLFELKTGIGRKVFKEAITRLWTYEKKKRSRKSAA